jgi:16S rRNA (cytosine967-C5)-methyltransferase
VSRYHSYLNTAKQVLGQYKGEEPFASFLKKFFSRYKKYGSKDRKQISHLCYCYFRLGKSSEKMAIEERILMGLFFCSTGLNEILEELKPAWNASIHLPLKEKCSMFNAQFSLLNVFPWENELSDGIDHEKFTESFFVQPDFFLRLRPGLEQKLRSKLIAAGIDFKEISPTCLALANATKIEKAVELDKEAVVQDYNSQQVTALIQPAILNFKSGIKVWDCCAGSGGKSLMLHDIYPKIDLTVSDVRESILSNLKKRFEKAGIKNYKSFMLDIGKENIQYSIPHSPFSIIMADVPCTGSGTWSRTPEQLYFFDQTKIDQYAALQKKIVSNVIPHLKQNGFFVYITCSVFKKENEEVADFLENKFHLDLIKMELLKGYDKKGDTMFAALFRKSTA